MSRACFRLVSQLNTLGPSLSRLFCRKMNSIESNVITDLKRAASSDETEAKRPRVEPDRVRRRKVAMLLAYSGQGYLGMQRNPETKTIEEDLLSALLKAGYITDEAFATAQTIQFQRAARTDKGVSAARQIVSLKLPDEVDVSAVNAFLPAQIRALAVRRATKGFNCKSSCDARTYSYLLPSMALAPPGSDPDPAFRAAAEHLRAFRATLALFNGTHNFHNFTSKKRPGDPSATRYIMSFDCGEPFVHDPALLEPATADPVLTDPVLTDPVPTDPVLTDPVSTDPAVTDPVAIDPVSGEAMSAVQGPLEFVEVRVKGQSFMLHQIRKMVGLSVAVARGLADHATVARAFQAERLDIPVAPGLGLVLEQVHYERYNQRYGCDGIHEALDWSALDDEVERFKRRHIYPAIVAAETKMQPMRSWLLTLPLHTYDVRERHLHQQVAAGADACADAGADASAASVEVKAAGEEADVTNAIPVVAATQG